MSFKLAWWPSLFILALAAGCDRPALLPPGQWIDLTYDLSAATIYWPTAKPFKLHTVSEGMTEKGYYYAAYEFCAAEHGGTHIDAPIHSPKAVERSIKSP